MTPDMVSELALVPTRTGRWEGPPACETATPETAWQIGREHDGYALVTFESLAANLLETLRRVYAHCDLPLTDAVAQAAERMPSRFSGKTVSAAEVANAWRSKLSPEHTVLVDRILADSPVRSFWE